MLALLAQARVSGTSNLASTQATFGSNTTNGNSIIVVVGSTAAATSVSGVTDAQGNNYTKAFAVDNTSIGDLEVWYTSGIIGGTTDQVTVAYSSNPVDGVIIISEYAGLIYGTALDQTVSTSGNSATPNSGTTNILTQPVELLIGAITTTLSNTITAGAGYGNLSTANGLATVEIGVEDQCVTASTTAYSASFGITSAQWACGIATFYILPHGTTTSTSFTTSTSMSSTSISSTSSSISSTSSSTSLSSTSTSNSSTSSSMSSTSSSTSSTSISSTSSSTSISSTSSSISSTSTSSTSTSSTSTSTTLSSTSTSFSSTSSSISSTSSSVSSTSFSSTSSSSSTSSTLPPPGYDYSYQDLAPAFKFIQNVQVLVSSVSMAAIVFNQPVQAGDLVIVNAKISGAATGVSATDNASTPNTYLAATNVSGNGNVLYQFYGVALVGGATTITVNWTGTFSARCGANEFSGNAPTNALVFDTANNNQAASSTSGLVSLTPANQGELIVAGIDFNALVTNHTCSPGYTFSNITATSLGESFKLSGTTNETPGFFWVTTSGWEEVAGAYLPAQPNRSQADLINPFTNPQYDDVAGDDGDYFIQTGSQNVIALYEQVSPNNTNNINVTWKGRTTIPPSFSAVLLQIFNQNSGLWETLASQTVIPADTDFILQATQNMNLSNYYDSQNTVNVRVYQKVV